jgi:phospholipase/carboxylesterase
MNELLRRPHVWLPGTEQPPLLLLHGTGGDEHDLLGLRGQLAAGSPTLSPRGTVQEHGMNRFFRRFSEGVFDEDDLRARTDELAAFLVAAEQEYGVRPGSWLAVGFSNGANIAAALLLRHPAALTGAVLLAAVLPFRDEKPRDRALTGKKVAVVNGRQDPLANPEQTTQLVDLLRREGADVQELPFPGGHTIDPRMLPRIRQFIDTHWGSPAPQQR